jgi:hypothetical protein
MKEEPKENKDHKLETAPAPVQNTKAKKPYHKPSFRYERVYETMALACGKMYSTESVCRFNRKTS